MSVGDGARPATARRSRRRGFVERTLDDLLDAFEHARTAERTAGERGLLQRLDPRAKVVGTFLLILGAALASRLDALAFLFALAVSLGLLSRVSLGSIARRAWLPAALFSGPVALPALFTTPGTSVWEVLGVGVTMQGVRTVAFLLLRVETTATLALVLVLTTPWPHVLKALHSLRVPETAVVVLGMTHRYLFLLLETALDMFEARRSRTVGALSSADRRRLAVSSAGALLGKSLHMSEDVYLAMRSRGFRGEVRVLDEPRMKAVDWTALVAFLAAAAAAVAWGRSA